MASESMPETEKLVAVGKRKQAAGMTTGCRGTKRKTKLSKAAIETSSVNADASTKLKTTIEKENESEYDGNLQLLYEEWGKKHKIEYSSEKERKARFKIFCASKKLVDEHNSMNPPGSPILVLSGDADIQVECGVLNKEEFQGLKEAKEGHDILSCSENDQLLRAEFDMWAKREGKTYFSESQREERCQIFCASKKLVNQHNSFNRLGNKLHLYWFSDMNVQCGVTGVGYKLPCKEYGPMIKTYTDEDLDRLQCDMPTLFDKFQKKYGIEYGSEEERQKRFKIFSANKKRIDNLNSKSKGKNRYRYKLTRFDDGSRRHPRNSLSRCDMPTLFDKWQKKYGIKYSSEEERQKRFKIFCGKIFCGNKKKMDYLNSMSKWKSNKLTRYDEGSCPSSSALQKG